MPARSKTSLGKKIIFSCVSVFLLFAVIEGLLRLIGVPSSSPRQRREMMWKRKGVEQDPTLPWSWAPIPDGMCIWNARGYSRFNSLGFRGPVFQKKKPQDTFRIVCMGDSCTMGWQVVDDRTYCAVLAHLLQRSFSKHVETINAGVLGYATSQGLHQLRTKILALRPDLVIASYNWNDHSHAIHMEGSRPDRDLPKHLSRIIRLKMFLSNLRIIQCLEALVANFRQPADEMDDVQNGTGSVPNVLRVPIEDYIQNWMEFISVAKQNHITLVLMTQPYKHTKKQDPAIQFLQQKQKEYNRALIQIALNTGTPCVDPTSDFHAHGKPGELFSSIVHPTELGHELIAKKLAETIVDLQSKSYQKLAGSR
jgi:lysophospholipase L1-like esterase